MADGVAAFRGIQAGKQGTRRADGFGKSTAAHVYLLGTVQLTPQTQFYNPREERRSRVETHRVVPVARHGEIRFESSLQFQRAPLWFSMLFGDPGGRQMLADAGFAAVGSTSNSNTHNPNASDYTGARIENYFYNVDGDDIQDTLSSKADGVPSIFVWSFIPYPHKLLEPAVFTLEYGDNAAFYRMIDAHLRSLTLRWAMNDAVMLSADIFGKFTKTISATANIPQPPGIHDAVSQQTDIYIGDVTDTNRYAFARKKTEGSAYAAASNPWIPQAHHSTSIVDGGVRSPGYEHDTDASTNGISTDPNPLAGMKKDGLCNALELTIPTGFEITRYTSGGIDFESYGQMVRTITANLTLRHSDAGRDEFAKYTSDAERRRLFRFVVKGPSYRGLQISTVVIDLTALYSEAPQFFTEQGGDDLFTMQASGYHEPNKRWNRDIAAYVVTDRGNVKSDSRYHEA